jgi:hypothetical protein
MKHKKILNQTLMDMGKKATKPRAIPTRPEQLVPESPEIAPAQPDASQAKAEGTVASQPEQISLARAPSAKKKNLKAMVVDSGVAEERKVEDPPHKLEIEPPAPGKMPISPPKAENKPEKLEIEPPAPSKIPTTPTPSSTINVDASLVTSRPPKTIVPPGSIPGTLVRSPFIASIKRGLSFFFKELSDKESLKFLGIAILVIGVSIGIALVLGQATYQALETNASNAGHLYGIITSSITFFFFARYLRHKKDLFYVRRFLVFYFVIYFCIVMLILLILQWKLVYFISTLGNSFILFSAYTLIIFIISPDILGVLGTGGNVRQLFLSGQHVRLILVYLFIALMQITGFSLLDFAIQMESGGAAYIGIPGQDPTFFGTPLDFFYFSMVTFVTIGYGDIHPALPVSELSSTIQALLSHVISILFLAVLLLYLSSNSAATTSTTKAERNEQ